MPASPRVAACGMHRDYYVGIVPQTRRQSVDCTHEYRHRLPQAAALADAIVFVATVDFYFL
jgi:hypothetical protein